MPVNTFGQPISQGYGSIVPTAVPPSPVSGQATSKATEPAAISSDMSGSIADLQSRLQQASQQSTSTANPNIKPGNDPSKAGQAGYDVFGNPTGTSGTDIQQARQNSGTYTGIDGNLYYNYDHSPAKSASSLLQTDENGLPTGSATDFIKAQTTDLFNYVKSQTDPITNSIVSSIQAQYENLINIQKMTNAGAEASVDTALSRAGASRYAPVSSTGISAAQVSAGMMAISDLQQKEQAAIVSAQDAAQKQNWSIVGNLLDQADKIRQEKITAAKAVNTQLQEQTRQANISQAVLSLVSSQGADANPQSIYSAMTGNASYNALNATAEDVQKAYTALVGSPQNLGTDYAVYQSLLKDGTLQKMTGNKNPSYLDYLHAKNNANLDPSLLRERELNIQLSELKLNGYVNLPTNSDGTVSQQDVEYGNAMRFAIANASPSEAQQRGLTFSDLLQKGDYSGARDFILQSALETSPNATYQQISGAANSIKALQSFSDLMDQMKSDGIDTNILRGTAEDLARKAGTTTNPKMVEFLSRGSKILFDYRKAMTGVQFSYAEGQQYAKLFPNYQNTIDVNKELISSLESGLGQQVETFYQQKLGTDNYDYLVQQGGSQAYGFGQVSMNPQIDQSLLSPNGSSSASTGTTTSGSQWK